MLRRCAVLRRGVRVAKRCAPGVGRAEVRCSIQHGAILAAHVCLLSLVLAVNEELLRLPLLLDGSHEIKLAL